MPQTSPAANAGRRIAAAATLLLAAACTQPTTKPSAAATPSPTASATPTRTVPNDPAGLRACQLADQLAKDTAALPDKATVTAITTAAGEAVNTAVRVHALLVDHAYQFAEAAQGGDDQLSTRLNLTTEALNMVTACIQAGFQVGGP